MAKRKNEPVEEIEKDRAKKVEPEKAQNIIKDGKDLDFSNEA